jgi:uncharacterized protein DUF4242
MSRYMVERTFAGGFRISLDEQGAQACREMIATNAKSGVTWIRSYLSADHRKMFCIYDGPSAEAIRETAQSNNLPIDDITVVCVLDPYFHRG